MKKSFAISAAALAAFVMTGCNTGGSNSYTETFPVRVSKEEVTIGGSVVSTSWTYDKTTGAMTGETRKTNLNHDYTIEDYVLEGDKHTRYRTWADGSKQKIVSTLEYIYNNNYETKIEVFNIGPNGVETTPVEVWDKGFEAYNNIVYPSLERHVENGNETLLRTNYNYLSALSCSYTETVNGGTPVSMVQTYESSEMTNYTIKTADGQLVEAVSDYTSDGKSTVTYKITRYDADRNATVTNVTEKYESITVTIEL